MTEPQTGDQTTQPTGTTDSEDLVHRFIDALHRLEERRDLEPIVALHGPGCDVGNVVSPREFRGIEGASEFSHAYRSTFGDLRSEFRNVIAVAGRAALEWRSVGTSERGHPIEYDGVRVLEFDGGKISRFRAYFDPSNLGDQLLDG